MSSRKSALREERGVTLVLMALMLFLALGMSALVIDYGMIKAAKAEAQRAMDASALAGASVFQLGDPAFNYDSAARARAKDYAVRHTVHNVVVDTAPPPGGNLTVIVDLGAEKVTATYTGHGIPLWFANIFGTSTMAINALATAHAVDAGVSACLMPVALPDMWVNNSPDLAEDANGNGLVDFNDRNGNHQWDWNKKDNLNEAWEQWVYDPSEGDYYNPPYSTDPTGYGSDTRDSYTDPLTGQPRPADYGRQMVLMELDPGSTNIPSNYLAWGRTGADASDSALAARIRANDCDETVIGDDYVRAANGSKPNLGDDWEYRINQPPSADWTWNDATNTVNCGTGGCPSNWQESSPRVVIIGLYDPIILTESNDNSIQFINFAKVFLDKRQCTGPPGQCKAEVTGRFLGPAEGIGSPGVATGPLVKRLELIK
jgi:Flp pilus assembly protein TadG